MGDRAPYSRVYWSVIDDPKFADVYDNDRVLACWLRLLIAADALWPAPAAIPASVSRKALAVLVKSQLVDLQPGGRYRIHGLDAERGRRARAATRMPPSRDPTGDQLGPSRDPEAFEVPGLSQAKPSQAKPSRAEPALDAYQKLFINVSQNALHFLDELTAEFGEEETARAIGQASLQGKDKLLSRVKTILVLKSHADERDEAAAERSRNAAKRAPLDPSQKQLLDVLREKQRLSDEAYAKRLEVDHD